jgi:hypothetical protein
MLSLNIFLQKLKLILNTLLIIYIHTYFLVIKIIRFKYNVYHVCVDNYIVHIISQSAMLLPYDKHTGMNILIMNIIELVILSNSDTPYIHFCVVVLSTTSHKVRVI